MNFRPPTSASLPYIGINVDRLPRLVQSALRRREWSRAELQAIWASDYGVSEKTAKEYISSLANLRVFDRVSNSTVKVRFSRNSEEHLLLENFYKRADWGSLLGYLCGSLPAVELLRSVCQDDGDKILLLPQSDAVQALKQRLKAVSVDGLQRAKSLEAFLRLVERAIGKETVVENSANISELNTILLPPRLRSAVLALRNDELEFLNKLLLACRRLAFRRPVYAHTAVFSIGDIQSELHLTSLTDNFVRMSKSLRDKNLLVFHRTIPIAAKQLDLVTVQDGAGVASAVSFPRRLWDVTIGKVHS